MQISKKQYKIITFEINSFNLAYKNDYVDFPINFRKSLEAFMNLETLVFKVIELVMKIFSLVIKQLIVF